VAVQAHRFAERILVILADSKDVAAVGVQAPVGDEVVDEAAGLEGGVQADTRLGPKVALVESGFDPVADPLILDLDERRDVAAVVANQLLTQSEDIHPPLPSCRSRTVF